MGKVIDYNLEDECDSFLNTGVVECKKVNIEKARITSLHMSRERESDGDIIGQKNTHARTYLEKQQENKQHPHTQIDKTCNFSRVLNCLTRVEPSDERSDSNNNND